MHASRRSGIAVLAVIMLACAWAPSALAAKKIPKARFAHGVYTSPAGEYSIKVPPLVEPGSWNEERQTSPVTQGAYFGDDLGRAFFILLTDNRKSRLTLDSIATEFQVGGDLREKAFVETARGTELRLAGILRGGSPLVSRTKQAGKWVEERLDMMQVWSLFLHNESIYQVTVCSTLLKDSSRPEAEVLADAKQRLTEALDALVIGPNPPSVGKP